MTSQAEATQLIDKTGFVDNVWVRVGVGEEPKGTGHELVRVDKLHGHLSETGLPLAKVGVYLDNDTSSDEIHALPPGLGLIAIDFPSFADGRGFSLARWVRESGFTGRLRASSPLIADQFAFAMACGFDEVEIPHALAVRQPEDQWLTAAGQITHAYQPAAAESILFHRHTTSR